MRWHTSCVGYAADSGELMLQGGGALPGDKLAPTARRQCRALAPQAPILLSRSKEAGPAFLSDCRARLVAPA